MIAVIPSGAAFLTAAMGFVGILWFGVFVRAVPNLAAAVEPPVEALTRPYASAGMPARPMEFFDQSPRPNMSDPAVQPSEPGVQPPMRPKRTLMEDAYRRLEEMIVTLEIAPGSVVSEAILSRSLNIGTTPIREALQRLAREHLVQILPRRGVIVTEVDVQQQLQVLEVRRELDRLIMRSAAQRASAAERGAFTGMAARMRAAVEAGDVRAFLRLDGEFNECAAAAARNPIAAETVAALHAVSRRFWFFHHRDLCDMPQTSELHIEAMRAIAAGDEQAAARGAERLIDQLVALAKSRLHQI